MYHLKIAMLLVALSSLVACTEKAAPNTQEDKTTPTTTKPTTSAPTTKSTPIRATETVGSWKLKSYEAEAYLTKKNLNPRQTELAKNVLQKVLDAGAYWHFHEADSFRYQLADKEQGGVYLWTSDSTLELTIGSAPTRHYQVLKRTATELQVVDVDALNMLFVRIEE